MKAEITVLCKTLINKSLISSFSYLIEKINTYTLLVNDMIMRTMEVEMDTIKQICM